MIYDLFICLFKIYISEAFMMMMMMMMMITLLWLLFDVTNVFN